MKTLCILLFTIMTISTFAQKQKRIFLRFYDASGNKFENGIYRATTDNSIVVHRDTSTVEVPISKVYTVRTRRSMGHKIYLSTLIEAIPLTILGASAGEKHNNDTSLFGGIHDFVVPTPGEAAVFGAITSVLTGTITGALLSVNNKTITINGDKELWRQFEKSALK